MYTSEKKVYKAKVGKLYVQSVNTSFSNEITLRTNNRFSRYLNEKEKDFLLEHFPDAEVKELTISESKGDW